VGVAEPFDPREHLGPAEVALANPLGQLLPAKRRRDRRNRPGRAEKTDAIVLPRAW